MMNIYIYDEYIYIYDEYIYDDEYIYIYICRMGDEL